MGDFLIDFREKEYRNISKALNLMRYFDDIKVNVYEYEKFILVLSRSDDWSIWGPYKSPEKNIFVALSGRIALESPIWEEVRYHEGEGGLACKAIYKKYKSNGIDGLLSLNGNYVVILYDSVVQKCYIVIDRCGMFPCYEANLNGNGLVFGSHPDILASVLDLSKGWDVTSMAEFLISGKVSFPYSYYKKIKAIDYGSIHTIDLKEREPVYESKKKYFEFSFKIDPYLSEWDLAEELAGSFKKAINRRTLSMFGQTAISLSGGLDSRTVLCSGEDRDKLWAFCFYDKENFEFKIAKAIAKEAGVNFIPLKRGFDHYGDSAEMGVRISGGMGDFGSNHYLGFRNEFKENGIDNIITGCYCDYFFKGVTLDKSYNKFLRTEKLSEFQYDFYYPFFWFETEYSNFVKERLNGLFPQSLKNESSDLGRLVKGTRRLFPLYYEPTNPQRVIPQRVMGWYLPIVDNDIIDIYLKVPSKYKLNASLFSKMAEIQCGPKISKIINCNTGARVNASHMSLIIHRNKIAMRRWLKRKEKGIATEESWPNWEYYLFHSKKIEYLWTTRRDLTTDIFREIMGRDPYKKTIREYIKTEIKLFLRLITLKLWLDQRV